MKAKIRLDTARDAFEFSNIVKDVPGTVTITDHNGLCVNGKSVIGALYSLEFSELWCESSVDIYQAISKFVVV